MKNYTVVIHVSYNVQANNSDEAEEKAGDMFIKEAKGDYFPEYIAEAVHCGANI